MTELVRGLGPGRVGAGRAAPTERKFFGLSAGRAITLAIVVCALALTLAVPLRTYVAQRSEAAQLAAQRVELDQDLEQLRAQRDQQEDPAFVRAEARQRLRLVQPGEVPYQVQLPGAYEAEQARRAGPAPKAGPWYTELWRTIAQPQPTAPAPPPAG
ncbi:FtsB family cell division protein [Skermania piniformis]|nr:septum formation initiator family protein [Skermania piniformis]